MKIFEILNGVVHYEMTHLYNSAEEARQFYAPNIEIVEAPDYVFMGWTFDPSKEGDERFIQPVPGDGLAYNPDTGEIFNPQETRFYERSNLHAATTNDTLQALRKIREGDTSIDWESWLKVLDDYNVAIEDTKNQKDYPLKVIYPDYPTKPTK